MHDQAQTCLPEKAYGVVVHWWSDKLYIQHMRQVARLVQSADDTCIPCVLFPKIGFCCNFGFFYSLNSKSTNNNVDFLFTIFWSGFYS